MALPRDCAVLALPPPPRAARGGGGGDAFLSLLAALYADADAGAAGPVPFPAPSRRGARAEVRGTAEEEAGAWRAFAARLQQRAADPGGLQGCGRGQAARGGAPGDGGVSSAAWLAALPALQARAGVARAPGLARACLRFVGAEFVASAEASEAALAAAGAAYAEGAAGELPPPPALYLAAEHRARLAAARALFRRRAHGPAAEGYLDRLTARCDAAWQAARQCGAPSLSGALCVQRFGSCAGQCSSGRAAPAFSGCGRAQLLRPDPFSADEANWCAPHVRTPPATPAPCADAAARRAAAQRVLRCLRAQGSGRAPKPSLHPAQPGPCGHGRGRALGVSGACPSLRRRWGAACREVRRAGRRAEGGGRRAEGGGRRE